MNKVPTWNELICIVPNGIVALLGKCKDTPQSPKWHPEGNVLVHTRIVYNRARETGDINLALAALFHDLGKAFTTKLNKKGDWSAYGHEFESAKIVDDYKDWITEMGADFDTVKGIVLGHMKIKFVNEMRTFKKKAFQESPVYDDIVTFNKFDSMSNLTDDEL